MGPDAPRNWATRYQRRKKCWHTKLRNEADYKPIKLHCTYLQDFRPHLAVLRNHFYWRLGSIGDCNPWVVFAALSRSWPFLPLFCSGRSSVYLVREFNRAADLANALDHFGCDVQRTTHSFVGPGFPKGRAAGMMLDAEGSHSRLPAFARKPSPGFIGKTWCRTDLVKVWRSLS